MGKLLLGAFYSLMNRVTAKLLTNEKVGLVPGPQWLLQLWLNLYMYKFVRPDLREQSFPGFDYSECSKKPNRRKRGCTTYGEAASSYSADFSRGKFFKLFYRGFTEEFLTWLPYIEDQDNNLHLPVDFRFEADDLDDVATGIFNCFLKPCALPV